MHQFWSVAVEIVDYDPVFGLLLKLIISTFQLLCHCSRVDIG